MKTKKVRSNQKLNCVISFVIVSILRMHLQLVVYHVFILHCFTKFMTKIHYHDLWGITSETKINFEPNGAHLRPDRLLPEFLHVNPA